MRLSQDSDRTTDFKRLLALTLATVMITVVFTPAVLATSEEKTQQNKIHEEDISNVIENLLNSQKQKTPIDKRKEAASIANESGNSTLAKQIKSVLKYYRSDKFRINSSKVLENDISVFSYLASSSNPRKNDIVNKIYEADISTVNLAYSDAKRAVQEVKNRSLLNGTELKRAENKLSEARQKFIDAKTSNNPFKGLKNLKKSWKKSQRVLEILDVNIKPQVEIKFEKDPLRHPRSSFRVKTYGTVWDIRPYELDNVTVKINNQTKVVKLRTRTSPARRAIFEFRAEFDSLINRVNASVKEVDYYRNKTQDENGSDDGSGDGDDGESGDCMDGLCVGDTVHSAKNMYLRDSPGGSRTKSVYKQRAGEIVDGPKSPNYYVWWKVEFKNGKTGWTVAQWIDKGLCEPFCYSDTVVATQEHKIRTSPSESGTTIATIPKGTKATPQQGPYERSDGVWWLMKYEDGSQGYAKQTYLKRSQSSSSSLNPSLPSQGDRTVTVQRTNGQKATIEVLEPDITELDTDNNLTKVTQVGYDVLRLDGDGLPDTFEKNILGTGPLNRNSNSSKTPINESKNDVLDTGEDFDGDGAPAFYEYNNSLEIWNKDTDGDKLLDGFEMRYDAINATIIDTNSDDTNDTREDLEDDGLTNLVEQKYGANATDNNTDGGLLNDSLELRFGYDPGDKDSNSSKTSFNESGNNISDGLEDLDNDSAPNFYEHKLGTKPFTPDTDSDGLTDGFETRVRHPKLDPLKKDTDGDGVNDPKEDIDGDAIKNIKEQELGTDHLGVDTDYDKINDSRELEIGTDPTLIDSDRDGIEDGEEIELGSDPLENDTDADGVVDRNETITENRVDEELGVQLNLSKGLASSIEVEISKADIDISGNKALENVSLSNIVNVWSENKVDDTNITLKYNGSDTKNESNLSIFRYRSSINTFVPVESTVHPEKDEITGETVLNGSSIYAVFEPNEWYTLFEGNSTVVPRDPKDGFAPQSIGEPRIGAKTQLKSKKKITEGSKEVTVETYSVSGVNKTKWEYVLDAPVVKDIPGLVVHRQKTSKGLRLYVYLDDSQNRSFGRIKFKNAKIKKIVNVGGAEGLDGQGNNDPKRGSKWITSCGEDEVYKNNSRTIDFNLYACGNVDSFYIEYEEDYGNDSSPPPAPKFRIERRMPNPPKNKDIKQRFFHEEFKNFSKWNCYVQLVNGRWIGTMQNCNGLDMNGSEQAYAYDHINTTTHDSPLFLTLKNKVEVPDSDYIFAKTSGKAHVSGYYNDADSYVLTGKNNMTSIGGTDNDGCGGFDSCFDEDNRTVSWNGKLTDISKFSGKNVSLKIQASARGAQNSTRTKDVWIEVGNISLYAFPIPDLYVGTHELDEGEWAKLKVKDVLKDSDNDNIPDKMEREGIRLSTGKLVKTDPYLADTDGDGLEDGEEVDITTVVKVKVGGGGAHVTSAGSKVSKYYKSVSDPTEYDTDGEGLNDEDEVKGYKVGIIDSRKKAAKFLKATRKGGNPNKYVNSYTVKSNAFSPNTDSDKLNDSEEARYETDPTKPDTDDDKIIDDDERLEEGDPTVYDLKPPRAKLHNYEVNKKHTGNKYWFLYGARDYAGVKRMALIKDGNTKEVTRYPPKKYQVYEETEFNSGVLGKIGRALNGVEVYVKVKDRNGNQARKTLYQRSNFYGQLAAKITEEFNISAVASVTGTLSGFTSGAGELVNTVSKILGDPMKIFNIITGLVNVVKNWDKLPEIIKKLPQAIENKQEKANPYSKGDSMYGVYRKSWYSGYIGFQIVAALAGNAAAKILKSSKRLEKAIDAITGKSKTLDRMQSLIKKAQSIDIGEKVGLNIAKRTAAKIGGVSKDVVWKVIGEVRTATGRLRVGSYLRKIDSAKLKVFKGKEKALARFLSRTDKEGVKLLQKLDKDSIDYLFCKPGTSSVSVQSSGCPFDDLPNYLSDASDLSEKELNKVVNRYESGFFGDGGAAEEIVKEADGKGVKFLAKVDEVKFKELNKIVSDEEFATFIQKAGEDGADLLDDFDSDAFDKAEDLYDDGKLDGDTLGEMSRLLKAEDGNLPIDRKSKFIDDDVDGEQLLFLVERNVNLKKTMMVVEDKSGNVRWLQLGDKTFGWKHIFKRHILGKYNLKNQGITSFFPVGQTKANLGSEITHMPPGKNKLSDVLGDWNKNPDAAKENVMELIFDTVKNGKDKGTRYEHTPNVNGISKIKVVIRNKGRIHTAYPDDGSKVNQWLGKVGKWRSEKGSNQVYYINILG